VPAVQAVEVVQAVVVALGSTGEVHWPCSWRLFAAYWCSWLRCGDQVVTGAADRR
jgi:hypothetical protein